MSGSGEQMSVIAIGPLQPICWKSWLLPFLPSVCEQILRCKHCQLLKWVRWDWVSRSVWWVCAAQEVDSERREADANEAMTERREQSLYGLLLNMNQCKLGWVQPVWAVLCSLRSNRAVCANLSSFTSRLIRLVTCNLSDLSLSLNKWLRHELV